MKIDCIWEHNGNDTLLYAENLVGALTRGENVDVVLKKMRIAMLYSRQRKSHLR